MKSQVEFITILLVHKVLNHFRLCKVNLVNQMCHITPPPANLDIKVLDICSEYLLSKLEAY